MDARRQGETQAVAAAQAGMSERSARRYEAAPVLPSQRAPRGGRRTRIDPLAAVWDSEVVPLLNAFPHMRATAVLEELGRTHPGEYGERVLRTLQRRILAWRAISGPERELIFRQNHPPGFQALSDFTEGGSLGVTIAGEPFAHLLYHFWMAFSGWRYVRAIQGGESFPALTEGLQEALWQLGAAPQTHRTDRLSAAYRNLADEDDASAGYKAFCAHYGMEPTRNNAGVSHENGSVEAAHGHLRRSLIEALDLRGSRNFEDLGAYQRFLAEIVARANARRRAEVAIELAAMRPLPKFRTTDFTLTTAVAARTGMICVRDVYYTVPSRLIGRRLKVHVHDDRLVCFLGEIEVLRLDRVHRRGRGARSAVIDYRHLVASLVKKPQAFRRYVHREALFPRPAFRRAWEALDAQLDERRACRAYVGLLHLAASQACEGRLADWIEARLDDGGLPDLEAARLAMAPAAASVPDVVVRLPDLRDYDLLFDEREAA